ncbi:N-acetyltransferase GCN5 [Thermosulfidibacter takaii ABI70S6]|uniref:N-acetyltransferase GCN5 n=1 Tax=Thermosulfidibacter takaii (strain DSM 17441 / JCM 13301 / NBRC 103674 / ABI70S6) TaxID=1298851 RepID=A0A0S3QUK5_THET7|nr:GNAT family N-acetyltransferase [Thermosulfidibacter takaii]BAT71995.1 N-acetyltransferase GCN5 [Thermosulfidibacter takaii ABI70S6]
MIVDYVLEKFPKVVSLKDGIEVTIRPLESKDYPLLLAYFLNELNEEDVALLKDDVKNPETIKNWCENINYERIFPLIAIHNESIMSSATLHMRNFGWAKYVGKVRITVSKRYRRKGLAHVMLKEIENIAREMLLERLWADIVLEAQDPATIVFEKAGYSKRATLKRIAIDNEGKVYDVAIYIKKLVSY